MVRSRLYVARFRGYSNVYAVIFEPRIEEFLEEFAVPDLKRRERLVKSREACRYLSAALDRLREVLAEAAARLCKMLAGNRH